MAQSYDHRLTNFPERTMSGLVAGRRHVARCTFHSFDNSYQNSRNDINL